jgi:monooxygenase
VPNLASSFGYTNASWTLKADLTCGYVCRLLNTMKKRGLRQATPRITGDPLEATPFLDFSSGYVTRAMEKFPKQGSRKPWKLYQNYAKDLVTLKFGSVDDGMEFSNPAPRVAVAAPTKESVAA